MQEIIGYQAKIFAKNEQEKASSLLKRNWLANYDTKRGLTSF
ncbi:TPA: hypothetical protein ACGO14_000055 [Streptococcus suis]